MFQDNSAFSRFSVISFSFSPSLNFIYSILQFMIDIYDKRVQTTPLHLVHFGPGPMVFRALPSNVQIHKCALKRYTYFIFVIVYYVLALQTK